MHQRWIYEASPGRHECLTYAGLPGSCTTNEHMPLSFNHIAAMSEQNAEFFLAKQGAQRLVTSFLWIEFPAQSSFGRHDTDCVFDHLNGLTKAK